MGKGGKIGDNSGMTGAWIGRYAITMQERSDSAGLDGQNVSESGEISLHNVNYGAFVLADGQVRLSGRLL